MKNILIKIFFVFSFSFLFTFKSFALQITDIDNTQTSGGNPSSYQFVELLNDTDQSIDISNYRVLDNGAQSTGHSISTTNLASDFTIPAQAKFIIAVDPTKDIFQNLNCKVYKSALKIAKIDNVSIKNNDSIVANLQVASAKTLNNTNCETNSNNSNDNATTSTSTKGDNNNTNNTENVKYIYIAINNQDKLGDIQILLPENKTVMALADTSYKVKAIDSNGSLLNNLSYHFSFGDGGEESGSNEVKYHYNYPGEYYLIASANGYTASAKAEMKVTVIPPELEISRVGGTNGENYIDIENNSDYDLYLSNFYLRIDGKDYRLPEDLLLAKGKITHLSGEAIGFKLPAKSVSLLYPDRSVLRDYVFPKDILNATNTTSTINNLNTDSATKTLIAKENNLNNTIVVDNKTIQNLDYKKDNQASENIGSDGDYTKQGMLFLKRLILSDNSISKVTIRDNADLNKDKEDLTNKDKNVDIGIINWFKNLIY